MCKELKKAIIDWLFDNACVFNRVSVCFDEFHDYIYNSAGNYLIGGETVSQFISDADTLLYGMGR